MTMGSKKHKKQKSENRLSEYEDGSAQEKDKPLKLVLTLKGGIGSSQDSLVDEASSPASEDRRHRHKKKKKKKSSDRDRERQKETQESYKRPREEDESEEDNDVPMGEEEEEEEKSAPENERVESHNTLQEGDLSPGRKLREPRTCTLRDSDGYVLKQMLYYLLKTLQNKDTNGFFAFPVTDSIAPGYSSIILNPMDFSTMSAKIDGGEYHNVMEFKNDYNLMLNNAMTYNRPETIFFKEAKRLMQVGVRLLCKEKLLHLKKTHSYLTSITLKELGFDESGQIIQVEPRPKPVQEEVCLQQEQEVKMEEDVKELDPATREETEAAEILSQAQEAAQVAKNNLVARKPKTDLGFLRMDENGTTSMTILNPWSGEEVSSKQRVISLGDYMGKLKNGTGSLFKYKEDKRNRVDTETYLCYGAFSSHAPSYDSSFASCTKEESELLLSTYGGEIGVQYAKSVQKFVENAGSSAVEMVDKLLDTLTNGQHSKARILQEQQKLRAEEQIQKALQDEMIAKAQQAADEAEAEAAKDKVQQNLNETAALLSQLSQTQNERLSQNLPPHLGSIQPPSKQESSLADQVSSNLAQMARQVRPNDVVSTGAVRGALGITTHPMPPSTNPSIPASEQGKGNTPYSSGDDSGDSDSEAGDRKTADSSDDDDDNENRPPGPNTNTSQATVPMDVTPDMNGGGFGGM